MKLIKKLTYTLPTVLLLWLAFGMASCIREEFPGEAGQTDYSSVTISVQMPAPVVTNPMTRAASDFDKMTDINIIIANGESDGAAILSRIYFKFADVADNSNIDGVGVTYTDQKTENGNVRQFTLNFSEEWLTEKNIPVKTCRFFLVANWGEKIPEAITDNVGQLKGLDTSKRPVNGDDSGIIAAPNVMFGKIDQESTTTDPDTKDACRNLEINLIRTAVMVTLKLNGGGLSKGIVISPTRISLHNVPNYCVLGRNNKITKEGDVTQTEPKTDAITLNGEWKDGVTFAQGQLLVGTETKNENNPTYYNDSRYVTSVGKHYTFDEEKEDGTLTNPDDLAIAPLFLYENYHGAGFGAEDVEEKNQWAKRPKAAGSTSKEAINLVAGSCSYIQVEADYTEYEIDGAGNITANIAQKGSVSWRFFLGKNVTDDFDVMRNHYYMVDLSLSGSSIDELKENSSWRVTTDLKEPGITEEPNMVVGGGGEMFCITITKPLVGNKLKLDGTVPTPEFVYVYAKNGNTSQWWPLSQYMGAGDIELTGEKQMWFYVSPFLPKPDETPDETPDDIPYRSVTIGFYDQQIKEETLIEKVSFTQYRPIKISIGYKDIFDENGGYDCPVHSGLKHICEDIHEVESLIETYYNYTFAPGNAPFVFYVDRVDRTPMPWGFSGKILDNNQTSGFENVYHLIDPNPVGQNCDEHQEYAKNYLPTGKGFKDKLTGYIDYTNGSCMMHAAMENYFQQYYPYPGAENTPNITPAELIDSDFSLPSRPSKTDDPSGDRVYGWCVPSIPGWQLLEKYDRHLREHVIPHGEGIFDPEHPILKWTSYWTSNTESSDITKYNPSNDGSTRSFVYQFDMKLDKMTVGDDYPGNLLLPRTTPIRYRLLNIHPNYLKDDSSIPGE